MKAIRKDLTNTMICWNKGKDGGVCLVPWPSDGNDDPFEYITGACWADVREWPFEQRQSLVFIEAIHMIVGDKCDPMRVHEALLGLDEYRAALAPDMPGASDE